MIEVTADVRDVFRSELLGLGNGVAYAIKSNGVTREVARKRS